MSDRDERPAMGDFDIATTISFGEGEDTMPFVLLHDEEHDLILVATDAVGDQPVSVVAEGVANGEMVFRSGEHWQRDFASPGHPRDGREPFGPGSHVRAHRAVRAATRGMSRRRQLWGILRRGDRVGMGDPLCVPSERGTRS